VKITLEVFEMERHGELGVATMLTEPLRLPPEVHEALASFFLTQADVERAAAAAGQPAPQPSF
jgi:hypothetical protein